MQKSYIKQVLIAIDQLINAIICNGWADETMSSVAWRMEQQGRIFGKIMRPTIDFIFFWDKDHCRTSFEAEREHRHLPPEAR